MNEFNMTMPTSPENLNIKCQENISKYDHQFGGKNKYAQPTNMYGSGSTQIKSLLTKSS